MKMFIVILGLAAVLRPFLSSLANRLGGHTTSSNHWASTISSRQGVTEGDSSDSISLSPSRYSSLIGEGSEGEINPATGLPMVGCLDTAGNMYGTDHTHWDATFDMAGSSLYDDHCSSATQSVFDD